MAAAQNMKSSEGLSLNSGREILFSRIRLKDVEDTFLIYDAEKLHQNQLKCEGGWTRSLKYGPTFTSEPVLNILSLATTDVLNMSVY